MHGDPMLYDSTPAVPEGLTAHAGEKLDVDAATPIAAPEAVIAALQTVHDPEIPVNIYDLGLIYDMDIDASGDVTVKMTLTAPACPVAGEMPQQVADAVAGVDGVGEVTVELVWEPPWDQSRMSETARVALDMW